jgi:hypothetical protein
VLLSSLASRVAGPLCIHHRATNPSRTHVSPISAEGAQVPHMAMQPSDWAPGPIPLNPAARHDGLKANESEER